MPQLCANQIADLALLMNDPMKMHLSDPGTGKTPTICVYQRYETIAKFDRPDLHLTDHF